MSVLPTIEARDRPVLQEVPPAMIQAELVSWVSDFLCLWEQSGVLHTDAAKAIISVVLTSISGDQTYQWSPPEAQALILSLENR
jgi:hypothetical protein